MGISSMNDINRWFLIATFDYRYVLPCSGAQGSTGHTTSELLAKVPLFVGGTQWHRVQAPGPKMTQAPDMATTLWLCQNSYWTWPSRNSWFSHWKWWILPSFFLCLPGRVSTVQSSGVTFSPVQTVLMNGWSLVSTSTVRPQPWVQVDRDNKRRHVKPGCECLMFLPQNLQIFQGFYLLVAIIVISWE